MTRTDPLASPQPATNYRSQFFRDQAEISARSAAAVVPILVDLLAPTSVVDVGCGVGTWLAEFRLHGSQDVVGYDVALPPGEALRVPRKLIHPVDLTVPLHTGRVFDVALCLEVGEHLPESAATTLVDSLVRAAPVVVFSAAIPFQGGTQHINEQWQSWWAERFAARGYLPSLALRRALWRRPDVASYYAQNAVVYFDPARAGAAVLALGGSVGEAAELDAVHPRMWERRAGHPLAALLGRVLPGPLKKFASSRLRGRVDYLRRV